MLYILHNGLGPTYKSKSANIYISGVQASRWLNVPETCESCWLSVRSDFQTQTGIYQHFKRLGTLCLLSLEEFRCLIWQTVVDSLKKCLSVSAGTSKPQKARLEVLLKTERKLFRLRHFWKCQWKLLSALSLHQPNFSHNSKAHPYKVWYCSSLMPLGNTRITLGLFQDVVSRSPLICFVE